MNRLTEITKRDIYELFRDGCTVEDLFHTENVQYPYYGRETGHPGLRSRSFHQTCLESTGWLSHRKMRECQGYQAIYR